MPDKDDAIVEAMARARCQAAGFDPDAQDFTIWTAEGEVVWPYAWHAEREPAAKQLAAHRAMIKAGKEQNDG